LVLEFFNSLNKLGIEDIHTPRYPHTNLRGSVGKDCYLIRDNIQDGSVVTKHVTSSNMLADAFTKPFGKETFSTMICKLGVLDIHSRSIFRKTKLF